MQGTVTSQHSGSIIKYPAVTVTPTFLFFSGIQGIGISPMQNGMINSHKIRPGIVNIVISFLLTQFSIVYPNSPYLSMDNPIIPC